MTDQFKRASISVVLNIAEGSGRTKNEFKRFLKMAKSSLQECVAILEIAYLQNYLSEKEKLDLRNSCLEISKMISSLIKKL